MSVLTITVHEHRPATQGSKKMGRFGNIIDDNPRTKPWRAAIALAALKEVGCRYALQYGITHELLPTGALRTCCPPPLDGPLAVDITFTCQRPQRMPKGRPDYPLTRHSGDLDKLLRASFDALATDAQVIADDSRIVDATTRKVHPGQHEFALDSPGAVIRVWQLAEAVTQ